MGTKTLNNFDFGISKTLLGKESVTIGELDVKQILQPQYIQQDAFTHEE